MLAAQLCLTLCDSMDCSQPGSFAIGFSRQEYWRGLPFPSPGDLPDPQIKPTSFMSPALAGGFFAARATWETLNSFCQVNSRFGQKHFINEINAKELITHEYNSSPMHKILKYTHLMNYVSSHI